MPIDHENSRKLIAGRWVRWNDERAARAYASGLWTPDTLADYLRKAAQQTPQRVLLIDGDCRIDCQTLFAQASALAQAMLARAPAGSVVSFMLPNWHEAGRHLSGCHTGRNGGEPDSSFDARPRVCFSF